MPERVAIVTGGRNYTDGQRVVATLDEWKPDLVIQGGALGADYLALMWAETRGVPVETFKANWGTYGRYAGPKRNREMAQRGADLKAQGATCMVFAFPGGPGTKSMCQAAADANLEVVQVP